MSCLWFFHRQLVQHYLYLEEALMDVFYKDYLYKLRAIVEGFHGYF